jgi:nucleoside-diphosphate-sugar epimerase
VRLLVTGATGFVGSRLIEHLAGRHELYAVSRRVPERTPDGCTWIEQDLRSLDPDALPDRVDGVIHLAQSPRYRDFPDGAEDMFAVNVASTSGLLEYARRAGARAFVLASTGGVYDYHRDPIGESEEPRPTTFYFRSKRAAEILAGGYADLFAVAVFRFFFVYGAGQTRMLIPTLIDKVDADQEIVIEGDPGLRINPIHVDDAIRAFEPALDAGISATINVAGPEAITITDLIGLIGELLGRSPSVTHDDAQPPGDLVADIGRLRELLDVVPAISPAEGLRATVAAKSPRP